MTRSRYLVGIDLGTTNCAISYVDTHGRDRPSAEIRNFEVPQLVARGGDRSSGHASFVRVFARRSRAPLGRDTPALE